MTDYSKIFERIRTGDEYAFLRNDKHKPVIIGLGGSYAYGTNTATSDVDVRGICLNTREELLTNNHFEQLLNSETDTTIYALNKIFSLLANCNPNTIEILGLRPEQYYLISKEGQMILDNKEMFLSKKAIQSFGGYANAQLRRLDNKAARLVSQSEQERHILNSIESARYGFADKYALDSDGYLRLYIDKSDREDLDEEIYMDVKYSHYPLRDYCGMWNEFKTVLRDYDKLGKRNKQAIEHGKLAKHMMHLVRLYLMVFDILENHEIVTYREKDHDLLMSIRRGDYLDEDRQPVPEFFEMVDELEKRLKYDSNNTDLPERPDYKHINELLIAINSEVCANG